MNKLINRGGEINWIIISHVVNVVKFIIIEAEEVQWVPKVLEESKVPLAIGVKEGHEGLWDWKVL
ncbi:hypothetical protein GCM10011384_10690 [Psychrobacillus lasiicapitis]|nr:hypothetical protein GCM10011384_10690 [Psychrobacillus lasiicapitis]